MNVAYHRNWIEDDICGQIFFSFSFLRFPFALTESKAYCRWRNWNKVTLWPRWLRISEWLAEWVNEWMNEWMNEWQRNWKSMCGGKRGDRQIERCIKLAVVRGFNMCVTDQQTDRPTNRQLWPLKDKGWCTWKNFILFLPSHLSLSSFLFMLKCTSTQYESLPLSVYTRLSGRRFILRKMPLLQIERTISD